MKRRTFLGLLGLYGCKDELENMSINKKLWWLAANRGNNNSDLFVVIGDSNADGWSDSIPTVASDTLYRWNGTSMDEITTQSISNGNGTASATQGSIWQQFATDYKANTGRPVYLITEGRGGSEFYPNGDTNNWYTSGTLYAAMQSAVTAAESATGKTLSGILLVLGVNDQRSANTIANIKTGIDSLFSRLTTDYPGVPILVTIPGGDEGTTWYEQRGYDIRTYIKKQAIDYDDVYIVTSAAFYWPITNAYKADQIHYSQTMNNNLGSQYARWFTNSSYTKWGRSVITAHYDDLSSGRKTLVDNFISAQITSGNYFILNSLHLFKTSNENNLYIDFSFNGYGTKAASGTTFTVNDNIETNGSSGYLTLNYKPSIYTFYGSTSADVIAGLKIKTNVSGSGANRVIFGAASGTLLFRMGQSSATGFTNYPVNRTTASNGTEATPADDSLYSIGRNGTNEYLIKNKTQQATNANAATGDMDARFVIGRSTAGTLYFAGKYEYFYSSQYSAFDLDSFYDDMETVIDSW